MTWMAGNDTRNVIPLVRFEASEKATIVTKPGKEEDSSIPQKKAPQKKKKIKVRNQVDLGNSLGKSPKLKVVNGRLYLKVGGFQGIQKIPLHLLISQLPILKLRLAAKKVLSHMWKAKKTTSLKSTKKKQN